MNPDTHMFEPLDGPAAFNAAQRKNWKIFKTGEKVTLSGTDFTVTDIQPTKLILRPFGLETLNSKPVVNGLQPHQQRVVTEKEDLDEKLDKLKKFILGSIFPTLPAEEKKRLNYQYDVMEKYSGILGERISAF